MLCPRFVIGHGIPAPSLAAMPSARLTSPANARKIEPMALFKKKKLADMVIFVGLAVNAVVILLILYFYVF